MAEYCSKYYAPKASIKVQSITIEDALKIRMLKNLGLAYKTYLTVINDRMQKYKIPTLANIIYSIPILSSIFRFYIYIVIVLANLITRSDDSSLNKLFFLKDTIWLPY